LTRLANRMPMVTLSWNSIFNAPRILEGAISERKTGTACHQIETRMPGKSLF